MLKVSPIMATSLKVLVASTQFSGALATSWLQFRTLDSLPPPPPKKYGGSLFSSFGVLGVLGGLCFQDTRTKVTIDGEVLCNTVNVRISKARGAFTSLKSIMEEQQPFLKT